MGRQDNLSIRAITFAKYHGKGSVGSSRLRCLQLMKYWPEYKEYTYGEHVDVMVYQKVYIQADWKFMYHFKGIQILDICDPDWLDNMNIKQTIDAMDGVTCPTEDMAQFLRQLTDKPVRVIPDRHDLELLPKPNFKAITGPVKSAVWFGYKHNAGLLKDVIATLERLGIELTVISDDDPFAGRWGSDKYQAMYHFKKFDETTIGQDLQKFDVCVLPKSAVPKDRFKSNNKTTLSQLVGTPVASDSDELEALLKPQDRLKIAKEQYDTVKAEYDVCKSVEEMKGFINDLQTNRK